MPQRDVLSVARGAVGGDLGAVEVRQLPDSSKTSSRSPPTAPRVTDEHPAGGPEIRVVYGGAMALRRQLLQILISLPLFQ